MATGTRQDFIIFNDWVQTGYLERIAQNVHGFNANSNNAINLTTESLVGDYREQAFFKELAQDDLVQDRDTTKTTVVTPAKMITVDDVIPYLPRRFGPYEQTRDAFVRSGRSPEEFSQKLGEALADAVMADMLNVSFAAILSALEGNQTMVAASGSAGAAVLSYDGMIDGMALFGDRLDEVACFVMRSADYFGLMKGNVIAATIDSVAGATLNTGSVATLGKPVLVTDSPTLIAKGAAAGDSGAVLALTANAITCIAAEDFYLETKTILGKENIILQWQGESQWGLDLKGYSYDKTKTPITKASLGLAANWSKNVTSDKNTGAALILTKK